MKTLEVEKISNQTSKKAKENFDCGYEALNKYIREHATQDEKRGLSVCYVLKDEDSLIGYYTLSADSIAKDSIPSELVKNIPYKSLPLALLGRLAININFQGQRYGEYLLIDALKRCCEQSQQIGCIAVAVNPKNDNAKAFYEKYGFNLLDSGKMIIMMKTVKEMLKP